MKKLFNYLIVSFLFVILYEGTLASELVTYGSKNIDFFVLNLENGNRTTIPCSVTHLHLAFAPNGTLYAASRYTDKLYRFTEPSTGALEYIANIPANCVGGDATVSPNGEGLYFTVGWTTKELFKYDIDEESIVSLGEIRGADSDLYGLAFSPDGILYGTTGSSTGERRLYTIDVDTLQATVIGPQYFGLGIDFTCGSLDFAPDGTLYTEIEGFLATIDAQSGIANIDYNIYTGGIDSIAITPEPTTPPVADAGGPYVIYVGDTLTLDASGSTDDDNDIVSYMWDLNDDETFETDAGSQAIFDVNYAYLESIALIIDHTYNIHVQVTDSKGQSDVADSALIIIPKPATIVAVDIKPSSCPNPLNVKSRGILPVAVLGSEDFDVSSIDAASIRLASVAPIRRSYEDIATPVSDSNECECSKEGPDGFLDLTLKFETQRIVETIGEVNHGDELVLELTGVLSDETPIDGRDCVIIRGKYKPLNRADFNGDGIVDMADFAAFAENWLQLSIVEY